MGFLFSFTEGKTRIFKFQQRDGRRQADERAEGEL